MSYSAYKTADKPLSSEALYRQRVKQGVFQSPSGTIVGVNSNASDTAALLAASSDLTVQPSYVRSVAPEAHTAALAAKHQEITAWERNGEDAGAIGAATSSTRRSNTLSSTNTTTPSNPSKIGIPSLNSGAVYKAANANSTSTMTSRINPEKDIRRTGIQSKQQQTSGGSLNIDKINKLATKNSTKSLNSRFNPDLDYRSGIKKQPPTEFLDQSEEDLAAQGATASLRGLSDQFSAQKRTQTFSASDVVNASLLKAANERAATRLNSIKSSNPAALKAQAQLYANALALAQQRSNERLQSHTAGLVNLGGGLTISQAELDKLASTYVQPILDDIEGKAEAKRKVDLEQQQKSLELKELHEKAKKAEQEAKEHERREIEKAKLIREAEHGKRKEGEDTKYQEYQTGRNKEIETKTQEYKDVEAKHAEEKEALLNEKKENQERIDKEEADNIAARKQELDDLQAEKDEILKPTLDELSEETAKLKEVENARDELKNEVTASENLNKEYEEKLAELEAKLEETKNDIEKYTTDLGEATTKHETTDKELVDLQELHDKEKSDADKEHEELDAKLEELEKEKQGHVEDKATKKKEILAAIDDKVKDEHKINSELPEHLRLDVDEAKIRDTSSLFSKEEDAPKEQKVVSKDAPKIKTVSLIPDDIDVSEPKKKEETSKSESESAAKPAAAAVAAATTAAAATTTAAAAKTATTPSKRPVTPSAAQPEAKKKPSFTKRLSSVFKYTKAEEKPKPAASTKTATPVKKEAAAKPAAKPTTTETKPATTESKPKEESSEAKKEEPKQVQPAAKDAEKEAKSVEPSEYGDFEDDISINKKENKGGVFTEEI